jgi:hypothetical protein
VGGEDVVREQVYVTCVRVTDEGGAIEHDRVQAAQAVGPGRSGHHDEPGLRVPARKLESVNGSKSWTFSVVFMLLVPCSVRPLVGREAG